MKYDEEFQNIKIQKKLDKITENSTKKIKEIEKNLNKEIDTFHKTENKKLNHNIIDSEEKFKRKYENLKIESKY